MFAFAHDLRYDIYSTYFHLYWLVLEYLFVIGEYYRRLPSRTIWEYLFVIVESGQDAQGEWNNGCWSIRPSNTTICSVAEQSLMWSSRSRLCWQQILTFSVMQVHLSTGSTAYKDTHILLGFLLWFVILTTAVLAATIIVLVFVSWFIMVSTVLQFLQKVRLVAHTLTEIHHLHCGQCLDNNDCSWGFSFQRMLKKEFVVISWR